MRLQDTTDTKTNISAAEVKVQFDAETALSCEVHYEVLCTGAEWTLHLEEVNIFIKLRNTLNI